MPHSSQRLDPRISDIPVVVLSADADGKLAGLAPAAVLPKPFELDRLLEVVGRYCARH